MCRFYDPLMVMVKVLVLLFVGLPGLGLAELARRVAMNALDQRSFRARAVAVDGEIVERQDVTNFHGRRRDVRSTSGHSMLKVRYRTEDGDEYTMPLRVNAELMSLGDTIPLLYDPVRPTRMELHTYPDTRGEIRAVVMCIARAVIFLGITTAFLLLA